MSRPGNSPAGSSGGPVSWLVRRWQRWHAAPLRDADSGSRTEILFIAAAAILILMVAELMLHATGRLGRTAYVLMFWIGNPVLGVAVGWLVHRLLSGMSEGLITGIGAAASTAPIRQYSEQDALVMQGRYAEAADMYRAIIADEPMNLDARLRLASLLELHVRDDRAAEAVLLEVRALHPSSRQEQVVGNGLIEIYRRTNRSDDLKRELTRMARRREGTPEGDGARRYLRELTEEHRKPGPP